MVVICVRARHAERRGSEEASITPRSVLAAIFLAGLQLLLNEGAGTRLARRFCLQA